MATCCGNQIQEPTTCLNVAAELQKLEQPAGSDHSSKCFITYSLDILLLIYHIFPFSVFEKKRLGVLSTVGLPVASYGCTWVDHQRSTCTIRCLFFLQTWADEWYPVSSSRTHRCEALSETASELIHDAPRLRACCCAIGWIGSFQNWKGSVLICNPIQGKEEVRNKPSVLSPIVFITRAGPGLI